MKRAFPACVIGWVAACSAASGLASPDAAFRRPRWDAPEATVRGGAHAETALRFGVDTGLWFANWSVRVDTPTSPHKTSSGPILFVAPRIDLDFGSDWTGSLRIEVGQASDIDTRAIAFRFRRPVLDLGDGVVGFLAGPVAASLDAHRFPGTFKDAVGFDLGTDLEMPLARGWLLRADATVRYLKFDYSRPPEVFSANDHSAGPVGLVLSVGATYDF